MLVHKNIQNLNQLRPQNSWKVKLTNTARSVLVNLVSTKPKLSIVSSEFLDNTSIAGETIVLRKIQHDSHFFDIYKAQNNIIDTFF